MKRRRHKQGRNMRALRLWTRAEAARAVPYLRSVIASLREHWLDAQYQRRAGERLAARPGRPDRAQLLRQAALHADQEHAETRFNEALEELLNLDVYPLDPVGGVALIPFRKDEDLAWYVFDQFQDDGLTGWRLHDDPLEQCRPFDTVALPPPADG